MAPHNAFGAAAERLVADTLARGGWTVLHRNWRWQHKEIDLIVRRGRTVAFVEVRARRSPLRGHPFETIGVRKRRDLAAAAAVWIARHGRAGDEYRFDAAAVIDPAGAAGGCCRIDHIEGAWTL
jgi:putative endonuclease